MIIYLWTDERVHYHYDIHGAFLSLDDAKAAIAARVEDESVSRDKVLEWSEEARGAAHGVYDPVEMTVEVRYTRFVWDTDRPRTERTTWVITGVRVEESVPRPRFSVGARVQIASDVPDVLLPPKLLGYRQAATVGLVTRATVESIYAAFDGTDDGWPIPPEYLVDAAL